MSTEVMNVPGHSGDPDHDPTAELLQSAQPRRRLSKGTLYLRRFLRNRPAVAGVVILILIILFALFGGLIAQHDYLATDFTALTTEPDSNHWFGTNNAGNDIYAQTVHGLQRSLLIALIVSIGTTVISAVVGASAAYFGGVYERSTLVVIHFLMVVPTFLILAMISNASGGNWLIVATILTLTGWFFQARVIWTMALSLREREYVTAARFMGVRGIWIVIRHIIPNIGSLLIIQFTLGVVGAVLTETSLSFLGFGIKAPDVSLGALIGSGANTITSAPWLFYFPAAALTLLTVSMALVADGLRDALDPTSTAGGQA
ncbi:ABC transporter permease [Microlunatus parietis]|uniref:Oligopeptide transport system permease protein OppC n=1 Tax=Microlunatus parietis TaxID=682979 RepID=A0A7Y9I5P4_9ACTN|nr:ABC transporter permease [Microlunatus parietis]NYE70568.1 peptide/nickel transport system permease protein [Microlunatus parietis]